MTSVNHLYTVGHRQTDRHKTTYKESKIWPDRQTERQTVSQNHIKEVRGHMVMFIWSNTRNKIEATDKPHSKHTITTWQAVNKRYLSLPLSLCCHSTTITVRIVVGWHLWQSINRHDLQGVSKHEKTWENHKEHFIPVSISQDRVTYSTCQDWLH